MDLEDSKHSKSTHSASLFEEYGEKTLAKQRAPKRQKKNVDGNSVAYVNTKATKNIIRLGKELLGEENDTIGEKGRKRTASDALSLGGVRDHIENELESSDEDHLWEDVENAALSDEDVDPNEVEIYERLNSGTKLPAQSNGAASPDDGNGTRSIVDAIKEHEAFQETDNLSEYHSPGEADDIPSKVKDVYSKIGLILSRYKSGKLPKPFKILPVMDQWEDLIAITSPDLWTPNAYYEATRLFISAKPIIAQRFLRDYLLWAVREDIKKTKKLNVHFYKALKRALFKPAAFFKAILFPLTSSGTCTLREAQIVGSVIARISVPVLHSAAALYHLSDIAANQMFVSAESGGAANIFIRILLEKKYALPYKVIDSLVFHFLRFRSVKVDSTTTKESGMGSRSAAVAGVEGKLPVLWHQCLLVFAQRYRNEITEDQREALLDLLADRWHHAISPVVERELLEGRERGTLVPTAETFDKDDTLMEM